MSIKSVWCLEIEIPPLFYSFVHGRLPYATLKPDPILRNIILSLPIRKVVCVLSLIDAKLLLHLVLNQFIYSLIFHFTYSSHRFSRMQTRLMQPRLLPG